jgi:predicted anti-sigma-YlaC factor YlaD
VPDPSKEQHPTVPNDLAHPAPEQLAAYLAGEAGDLDRAGIAGHLAGCPACSAETEAIEAVTGELAGLEEPDLPPGFHDRLMAAVQAELDDPQPVHDDAQDADAPPVPVTSLDAARRRRRGLAGRPLTWGAAAAAALLIAVVGVTQLRDQAVNQDGGATAAAPAPETAAGTPLAKGAIPVFRLSGELDLAQLRSAVSTRPELQAAYQLAAGTAAGDRELSSQSSQAARSDSAGAQAPPGLDKCLAAAGPGASPAFFVEGTYQGKPATMLVTVEAQGRLGLYVFGRDDCTALLSSDSGAPPATSAP